MAINLPGLLGAGTVTRDHSDLAAFKIWAPLVSTGNSRVALNKTIYLGFNTTGNADSATQANDQATPHVFANFVGGDDLAELLYKVGWTIRRHISTEYSYHSRVGVRYATAATAYDLANFPPIQTEKHSKKPFLLLTNHCNELGSTFFINPTKVYNALWQTIISNQSVTGYNGRADMPPLLVNKWIQENLLHQDYRIGMPFVEPDGVVVGWKYTKRDGGLNYKTKGKKRKRKSKINKNKFY